MRLLNTLAVLAVFVPALAGAQQYSPVFPYLPLPASGTGTPDNTTIITNGAAKLAVNVGTGALQIPRLNASANLPASTAPKTCNGMALDGTTDDLSALNACLLSATPGVPVDVQPGLLHLSGNPTGLGSVVRLSGNKYGTGGTAGSAVTEIAPGALTETYLPDAAGSLAEFYGKKNSLPEPGPTVRVDGIFNATGTLTTNTVDAQQTNCQVNPSGGQTTDYVWCHFTQVNDYGTGGAQDVAVGANIFRPAGISTTRNNTWAGYFANGDESGYEYGDPYFTGGQSIEADTFANGADNSNNVGTTTPINGVRMGIHIGMGRDPSHPNYAGQFGNGLVVTTGNYFSGCTHVGCAVPDFANHAINVNSEWAMSGIDFSNGSPLATTLSTNTAVSTGATALSFSVSGNPLVTVMQGMAVAGTNIPAGTTVSSVNAATGIVSLSGSGTTGTVSSGASITFTSSAPAINLGAGQSIDLSNGGGGTISDNGTITTLGHKFAAPSGSTVGGNAIVYGGGSGADLSGYTTTPTGIGVSQASATALNTILSQQNWGTTYGLVDDGVYSGGTYTGTDNTVAILKMEFSAASGVHFKMPKGIMLMNMADPISGTPTFNTATINVSSVTYNASGMGSVKLVLASAPSPVLAAGQHVLVAGFTCTGTCINGWDEIAVQNNTDSTGGTTLIIATPGGNPGTITGTGTVTINTETLPLTYPPSMVVGQTLDWEGAVCSPTCPTGLNAPHTLTSITAAGNFHTTGSAKVTFDLQTNPGTISTLGTVTVPAGLTHLTNFGLEGNCDSTQFVYTGTSTYIHFWDFGFGLGSAKGGPGTVSCITFQSITPMGGYDSNPLHRSAAVYVSNANNINFDRIYADFSQTAIGDWQAGIVDDATIAMTLANIKATGMTGDCIETFGPGVDPITFAGNGNQFDWNMTGENRIAGCGANGINAGGGMDASKLDFAIIPNAGACGIAVNEALAQAEYGLEYPDNNNAFPVQRLSMGSQLLIDFFTTAAVCFNQNDLGSTHILHTFPVDAAMYNGAGPAVLITNCNDCNIPVNGIAAKNNGAAIETADARAIPSASDHAMFFRNVYGVKADVPVTLGRIDAVMGAGADANTSGNFDPNGNYGMNNAAVLPQQPQACAAAGSTQGAATLLTGTRNYIAAGGSAGTGCMMPPSSQVGTGEISLTNLDSVAHNLWPQTGDTLSGASGVNTAYSVAAGATRTCAALSVNTGVTWACH